MAGIAIAVFLVAYNNLLNLWPPFNKKLYVPLNLSVAVAFWLLAVGPLDLSLFELGMKHTDLAEVGMAVAAGVALTLPLFVAVAIGRATKVIADERVKGLWGRRLAYQVLVRVPIGTALLEELAFRGVLFTSWRSSGTAFAATASSVAFGLWHVSPTLNLVRANRPDASSGRSVAVVLGAVAFTFAAGLALTALRVWSASLLVPFALHATVNSLATVGAALAHRKRR